MPVIAALEFDDIFPLGEGPRQANGRHGGFSAGADQAQHLDGGHGLGDHFRQLSFRRRAGAEACACARGRLDGAHHYGRSVAQNERPPGADIINVAIAIGIEQIRALAAHNHRRRAAHRAEGTHRRVHSAGHEPLGARLQALRFAQLVRHGFRKYHNADNQFVSVARRRRCDCACSPCTGTTQPWATSHITCSN